MADKLWGTRFPKKTSVLTDRFTSSISYDRRLALYDIRGSIAHARMLGKQGIIPARDAGAIVRGLQTLEHRLRKGLLRIDPAAEDIHSAVQEALQRLIGAPAARLHTARSRNDQIALDIRLYMKDAVQDLCEAVVLLQRQVVQFARQNKEVIIPGYTHLQTAQCVLLSHHLLAYVEALERDRERLSGSLKRIDQMPLGSGALSGTGLPIDREAVRRMLGFSRLTRNSIDSVSDRDSIIEVLAALSILMVHLSRIAEDLILWATKEFHFIDIDFSFCTGSSIMPHKKNPDVLELIRGSAAQVHGSLSALLMLMKGLPLSYNRDLQLDKPPLFESVDTAKEVLAIFVALFQNIVIEREAVRARINDEALFSVDIVEYLIRKGASYRQAHDIVGRLVRECLDKGRPIRTLGRAALQQFSPLLKEDVKAILSPEASVRLKRSRGGTNPQMVGRELARWERVLGVRRRRNE